MSISGPQYSFKISLLLLIFFLQTFAVSVSTAQQQGHVQVSISDSHFFRSVKTTNSAGLEYYFITDSLSRTDSTRRKLSDQSAGQQPLTPSDPQLNNQTTSPQQTTVSFSDQPPTAISPAAVGVIRNLSEPTAISTRRNLSDQNPRNRVASFSQIKAQSPAAKPFAAHLVAATKSNRKFAQDSDALPSHQSTSAQPNSGSRLIQSNLGNMQFVKAKQFLRQTPEFEDPSKYLKKQKAAPRKKKQLAASRSKPKNNSTKRRTVSRSADDSVMPEPADVRLPISPVPFGGIYRGDRKLLTNDLNRPQASQGDQFNYAQLTRNDFVPSSKAWLAPNFAHNPLYFEEAQLERYGNRRQFQTLYSGLHFFGTIPVLPYKMGADHPRKCDYTYGNYRPGDCVPYDIEQRPLDKKGLLNQALWTSAVFIPH